MAGWTTILDLDFAAQGTQTLAPDGNYTIAGLTFRKLWSTEESSAMTLTNGSGVIIQPTQGGDNSSCLAEWRGDFRKLPMLALNIQQVISSFSFDTPIRIWAYNSANNSAANYDAAILALDTYNASVRNSFFYSLWRGYSTTTGHKVRINISQNNYPTESQIAAYFAQDVMVIDLPCGVMAGFGTAYSGTWSAGWPALSTLQPLFSFNVYGNNGLVFMATAKTNYAPSTWDVFMAAQRDGAATALSITFANLRIDYKA